MLELTTMKDNKMAYLTTITILYLITLIGIFAFSTYDLKDTFEILLNSKIIFPPFIFSLFSLFLYKFFKNRIFRILLNAINLIIFNVAYLIMFIFLIASFVSGGMVES